MKKTYITPEMLLIHMNPALSLMSTSSVEIDPNQGGNQALAPGNEWDDIWNKDENEEEEPEQNQDPYSYYEY